MNSDLFGGYPPLMVPAWRDSSSSTKENKLIIKGLFANLEFSEGVISKKSDWFKEDREFDLADQTHLQKCLLVPTQEVEGMNFTSMQGQVPLLTYHFQKDKQDVIWEKLEDWYQKMYDANLYPLVLNEACFVINLADSSLRYHALEHIREITSGDLLLTEQLKSAIYTYWVAPLVQDFGEHLSSLCEKQVILYPPPEVPSKSPPKVFATRPQIEWQADEERVQEVVSDMVLWGSCSSCASYVSKDNKYYIRMIPCAQSIPNTETQVQSDFHGSFGMEVFNIYCLPSRDTCSFIPTFYSIYSSSYRYDDLYLYDTPFLNVYRRNNKWQDPVAQCGIIITDNWPDAMTLYEYVTDYEYVTESPNEGKKELCKQIHDELMNLCVQFVYRPKPPYFSLSTFDPYNIFVRHVDSSNKREYRIYDYSTMPNHATQIEAAQSMMTPIRAFLSPFLLFENS